MPPKRANNAAVNAAKTVAATAVADSASPSKKAKAGAAVKFNANGALDKAHEGKRLRDIVKLPPSALEGLAERCDPLFKAFHIHTIKDLASWKHARVAQALLALSTTEEKNKRAADSQMNINKAIDKDFQDKSLKELLDAPVSALKGLAEWTDSVFNKMHIHTINDLAKWKYVVWAQALEVLAEHEE